jgi:circadian clock protein KaiB
LSIPPSFKGIALFTPGGDLVYSIDANKQEQWHLQLCVALQEALQLPEPPHFLVPCYSATVDRWYDSHNRQMRIAAEIRPPVRRYVALLNAVFELGTKTWQIVNWQEQWCDPMVLATYQQQFPQLWVNHDLVIRVDQQRGVPDVPLLEPQPETLPSSQTLELGYTLRLYVAGINPATEGALRRLHRFLETSLRHPYTLEVIDIHRHPDKAEADQIAATPTLIKVWPRPIRRVIGELDRAEKILQIFADPISEG